MRSLSWVLLALVVVACKEVPKEPEAPAGNGALAVKLDAYARNESPANLTAVLNTLRTANLYVAVKASADGAGWQAAIHVDPKLGQVLYAFLDEGAARAFWSENDVVVIRQLGAPAVLSIAQSEQTAHLIIEPHLPDRALDLPQDNFAPITKAWSSVGSGTPH